MSFMSLAPCASLCCLSHTPKLVGTGHSAQKCRLYSRPGKGSLLCAEGPDLGVDVPAVDQATFREAAKGASLCKERTLQCQAKLRVLPVASSDTIAADRVAGKTHKSVKSMCARAAMALESSP